MSEDIILKVEKLTKYYTSGYILTSKVLGCKDVSFRLRRGEVLSLVGESGSGKSTVANMILRLFKPTTGKIYVDGKNAFSYDGRDYWQRVQAVFQDPYSSFNNFYTVDKPLMDAFKLLEGTTSHEKKYSKTKKMEIIRSTLKAIGVNPDEVLGRYPHQVSGGQLQRLLLARSLIVSPDILIADEPTSMTDASTRVGILNELLRLRKERGMAILFITHDVGQAYYISDRTIVMKRGRIVEEGPSEKVLFSPEDEYTRELISSVPKLHKKWSLSASIDRN